MNKFHALLKFVKVVIGTIVIALLIFIQKVSKKLKSVAPT